VGSRTVQTNYLHGNTLGAAAVIRDGDVGEHRVSDCVSKLFVERNKGRWKVRNAEIFSQLPSNEFTLESNLVTSNPGPEFRDVLPAWLAV
jgi:hypothetical protein